ncbi:hypothetical protein AFCDBAGC_2783 [Methylobacterium cerastii]|uniref:Antitoxin SocA-like Panacea domain-containing protein n=1 Tax=Methylobacterium cerastii TaxID=932741 RepID=A0ABQ4QJI8_9HYPH|nr:Panacea domain-containing protein [Methylobacterium cerastii]GJD44914.1 hypothetical protein AFCDBAGC_2783 [Methylobacterium cerastii]
MLVTHEREKLIQAINFFARHTRKCGKVKLFKLLYFLDFEHYKRTGRSVTGQTYNAWKMGPVPVSLFEEISTPQPDMAEVIEFAERPISGSENSMLVIRPKIDFSDRHFTSREMIIMRNLAKEFENAAADDMIEATHLENLPWDKIYRQQGQKQQVIPYELALRPDEIERVSRVAQDRKELVDRLG